MPSLTVGLLTLECDSVIARVDNIHRLHGKHDHQVTLQLLFASDSPQLQLTGAPNHQFQNVIYGVAMHAGSFGNQLLYFRADAPQKGSRRFARALV